MVTLPALAIWALDSEARSAVENFHQACGLNRSILVPRNASDAVLSPSPASTVIQASCEVVREFNCAVLTTAQSFEDNCTSDGLPRNEILVPMVTISAGLIPAPPLLDSAAHCALVSAPICAVVIAAICAHEILAI